MSSMHTLLPQSSYKQYIDETREWVGKSFKKSLSTGELTKLDNFKKARRVPRSGNEAEALEAESPERAALAHKMMREMILAKSSGNLKMEKAGVTTTLGYNFYDLRAPVQLLYPVNVYFRNELPRIGRVNDGYGTAAQWKATRNPGTVYAGVPEGQRNAIAVPDENNYTASYKELGVERGASFTSEFAAQGYTDILADEHIRGYHELILQEEGMMLLGNSGTATGNNGFQLGTATTPTVVLNATAADGTLPTSTNVSVSVVFLTGLGNPTNGQYGYQAAPTVAGGLTPSFTRTSAANEVTTINGGMSAVSAMSAVVQTTSPNPSVLATVPVGTKGVFGYAWFVNITDSSAPTLANAKLAAITTNPKLIISSAPLGTQSANAAGLNVDHSSNQTDFDGLITYTASTFGTVWTDLNGASLTPSKGGRVVEIETILQTLYQRYQTGPTCMWCSADAAECLDQAVRWSGTSGGGFQFVVNRDGQNNILGGFVVSGYQSRFAPFNPTGAQVIPIRIHPMMPAGTIFFDIDKVPYPTSRSPFSRGMLVQREYYSIEWPLMTRQWTFGTYVHEVLAHNFPWITAVLTGIGAFSGN